MKKFNEYAKNTNLKGENTSLSQDNLSSIIDMLKSVEELENALKDNPSAKNKEDTSQIFEDKTKNPAFAKTNKTKEGEKTSPMSTNELPLNELFSNHVDFLKFHNEVLEKINKK